jgi:HSP20 family protein
MATENRELITVEAPAFVRRVLRDIDRWFVKRDEPFFAPPRALEGFAWLPELEVLERENQLLVRVDLPGLKKEEVTVTVGEEGLTIEGERKLDTEKPEKEWYRTERAYGRFFRHVALPKGFKPETITATFGSGVLEVKVPLPTAADRVPRRKVEIEQGEEKKDKESHNDPHG